MAKRVVYFYDCYCGSFFRIMRLRFLVVYVVSSTMQAWRTDVQSVALMLMLFMS